MLHRLLLAPFAKTLALIFITVVLSGCGGSDDSTSQPPNIDDPNSPTPDQPGNWYQPKAGTRWQWQLAGELNTHYNVAVYDIDLFDTPSETIAALHADGRKVICYFSAGSYEAWRTDAALFATVELGDTLDGWPDERWLDIRSANVLNIMQTRIALAADKGCDAVEPDNVDGYSNNSGFNLSDADQLNYNKQLATYAHQLGLGIGLKNDLMQIVELVDHFDFAVNEQCFQYQECDYLAPFIAQDKAVFNAEYSVQLQTDSQARQQLCQQANSLSLSTLILPLELDDSFRFSCLE